ncbi:MAG: class I SAM-dependent methyltransferase [Blastomonas sp.]
MADALPSGDAPVLLLGVTPELSEIVRPLIAMDWGWDMIGRAWVGNGPDRNVVCADWLTLPLDDHSVRAAIGDACLSILEYPLGLERLIEQLCRAVVPGGRIVLRCFATGEPMPGRDAVRTMAMAGTLGFHQFKLMFNMATVAESGSMNMACPQLLESFNGWFSDRAALSRASGWSLETIAEYDAYHSSPYVHCFPTRSQLTDLVPTDLPVRFVETCGYPGAEYCPLLIIDLP